MTEKTDLRYHRTERLLKEAFMEQLAIKPVDKITIKDLADRAEINRTTFYRHYEDIYDLLESIEDEILHEILEMMQSFHPNKEDEVTLKYFNCFCQFIYDNRLIYKVLTTQQETKFIHKVLGIVGKYQEARRQNKEQGNNKDSSLQRGSCQDKTYMDFAITYAIGGVIGILHKWMAHNFKEPPIQVADYISKVFLDGMRNLF